MELATDEKESEGLGHTIASIAMQLGLGTAIEDVSYVHNMPVAEIEKHMAVRDRIIQFERGIDARPPFSIPFTVPKHDGRKLLTCQQLIDYLRTKGVRVLVNEKDSVMYESGFPITRREVLELANEYRARDELPVFRLRKAR